MILSRSRKEVRKGELMNKYELFNEKTAEFLGPYSSDKMLEKGDVITFQGKNYFVFNLMIPSDGKLRVAVWPTKISLPGDLGNLRLFHWIQKSLTGLKVKIYSDYTIIKGIVINDLTVNLKPEERPETFYDEELPWGLEILPPESDRPITIDLLSFSIIEILGN